MSSFVIHDEISAPEGARETLVATKTAFGFLPNLYGGLAESPAAVEAYAALSSIFDKTSLDGKERQVVLLTINFENECQYCVAAHTGAAKRARLDDAVIEALRNGDDLPDARYQALADFTRKVIRERGWVSEDDVSSFIEAGFSKAAVLDVILAASLKTISNYFNHVAETPLDDVFKPFEWTKPGSRAA